MPISLRRPDTEFLPLENEQTNKAQDNRANRSDRNNNILCTNSINLGRQSKDEDRADDITGKRYAHQGIANNLRELVSGPVQMHNHKPYLSVRVRDISQSNTRNRRESKAANRIPDRNDRPRCPIIQSDAEHQCSEWDERDEGRHSPKSHLRFIDALIPACKENNRAIGERTDDESSNRSPYERRQTHEPDLRGVEVVGRECHFRGEDCDHYC